MFVYFARKTSRAPGRDTWLAISRPPWSTALSLWFIGGTYFTGGYFKDRRTVWLGGITDDPDQGFLPDWLERSSEPDLVDPSANWTERTVFTNRLKRDGWIGPHDDSTGTSWEHPLSATERTLRMIDASGKPMAEPKAFLYAIHDGGTGQDLDLGHLSWADWDHRGRLIIARDGRLWHWINPEMIREIADFRAQSPHPEPSPPEALTWPPPPLEQQGQLW